jgi:hypothetical protein
MEPPVEAPIPGPPNKLPEENTAVEAVVFVGPPKREPPVAEPPKRVVPFAPPAVATFEKLKSEPV